MNRVCASPRAKVNLGLEILGRRADGLHEIRTVLQTIDLADEMIVERAERISLVVEGLYRVEAGPSNLVMQAASALAARLPGLGARITLRKRIPAGAGLGGGSSDAAATLMALDRLWGLDADPGLLYELARGLGADVPFFLYGGTCLAVGRGDEVLPLPDGPAWSLIVAWCGEGLSTREIYASLPSPLTRPRIPSSMKGFTPVPPVRGAPGEGRSPDRGSAGVAPAASPPDVHNDLESAAFQRLPGLQALKARLLESGAVAAAMTGSGSAVFGLYPSSEGLERKAASLARGGVATFVCHTLSRDAYRRSLFERSQT